MIYSYGARNYFSFKEGMVVSFELNSKVPKSISNGRKISTVLGVKGANASGKTNVLKCLAFIANFIGNSFGREAELGVGFSGFFRSKEISEFYIDFEVEGVRYIYELEAFPNKVVRESLYKKVSRKTLVLERVGSEIKKRVSEFSELDLIELSDNASVISSAMRYKFRKPLPDLESVYKFFRSVVGNVYALGALGEEHYSSKGAAEFYYNNPEAFEFAKSVITKSDLGITGVDIRVSTDASGEKVYIPIFFHNTDCDEAENRWLTYWDESKGTVTLFNKLFLYWGVLSFGGVLVMDEFDVHCHNMLLPRLVKLFTDKESNPSGAQFIFTAHSTEIIDYLGKYRTLLVSKERSESFCYRLDEIPGDIIRNDRSLAALYREGKIGGVPRYEE